ncbi:MAG: PilN domain-containing protein [Paeniclostridium sordellii]|uniref:PilN domain-containing protein n=1 Tax=Paeniclostridium hominis TaxID=2764329 RepID=A0ABR7K521_9FIRM|nr:MULTISPECIES: PilN domain-containing protein [Paeniclostridium]MBC6004199.1 PilN domain-containing protein [Paeniclostridium hominis]MDU2591111.1 PilN domain-containing protein [Paeniclostridium sordellii]
MDNIKSINFFNEKEKYKKDVNILNLIVLGTILIMLLLDAIKVYELNDLEIYVNESKKAIDNLDGVNTTNVNGLHIKKVNNIIQLIQNDNIENIEIDNNILKLKGKVSSSQEIKYYVKLLQNIKDLKIEPNINSINREGELYKFEITARIGVKNEG